MSVFGQKDGSKLGEGGRKLREPEQSRYTAGTIPQHYKTLRFTPTAQKICHFTAFSSITIIIRRTKRETQPAGTGQSRRVHPPPAAARLEPAGTAEASLTPSATPVRSHRQAARQEAAGPAAPVPRRPRRARPGPAPLPSPAAAAPRPAQARARRPPSTSPTPPVARAQGPAAAEGAAPRGTAGRVVRRREGRTAAIRASATSAGVTLRERPPHCGRLLSVTSGVFRLRPRCHGLPRPSPSRLFSQRELSLGKDCSFSNNVLHCTEIKKERLQGLNLNSTPNNSRKAGARLLRLAILKIFSPRPCGTAEYQFPLASNLV
ncbi:sterile alpha motif domain-containing protein 1-like [Chroicocephalus ridibundus]|uniref:sterile alpha motif domain-containing protein 1-like n=1 Tax=Chroicocephalus ridibundus TaxID=1192867 RepID=UPI002FDD8FD7